MDSKRQLRSLVFEGGFDERDEYETLLRGYRSHVVAELEDGSKYRVTFYDPVRLKQVLDDEVAAGMPFFAEPGLIIVSEVTGPPWNVRRPRSAHPGFLRRFGQSRIRHLARRRRPPVSMSLAQGGGAYPPDMASDSLVVAWPATVNGITPTPGRGANAGDISSGRSGANSWLDTQRWDGQTDAEEAAGAMLGLVQTATPYGFLGSALPLPTAEAEWGRAIVQLAVGLAELAAGATAEVGGVALDTTGIGAPAGVALNVGGAVAITKGIADLGAGAIGVYRAIASGSGGRGLTSSQQKTLNSLKERVAEHKAKLEAYRTNPDAADNKGFLRNAPNAEVRTSIIEGRIKHLQNEIQNFEKQIADLEAQR